MLRRGRPCVCPKSIRHGSRGKRGDTRHNFNASTVTTAQKQGETKKGGHSGPPLRYISRVFFLLHHILLSALDIDSLRQVICVLHLREIDVIDWSVVAI